MVENGVESEMLFIYLHLQLSHERTSKNFLATRLEGCDICRVIYTVLPLIFQWNQIKNFFITKKSPCEYLGYSSEAITF